MRDEELLLHLRAKYGEHDTHGFNFFDLLHLIGSPLDALLYSKLFWPEFVEIEGMFFLKETVEDDSDRDRIFKALKQYGEDKSKVEQSFNLIEIPSIFGKHLAETTDDEDRFLAERLAEIWRQRFAVLYPTKTFLVEVLSPEQTGSEVAVLFYSRRAREKPGQRGSSSSIPERNR